MLNYEKQVRDFMLRRCREHMDSYGQASGRKITYDYRFEHTRTTAGIAGNLAERMNVDPTLARIAAWLHDIAKCWDPRLDRAENLARAKNHGPQGGEEAAAFLDSIGFPRHLTSKVKQAITVHVGFFKDYILDEPLDALLWDADKLSKVSIAGVMNFLGGALAMGSDLVDLKQYYLNLDLDWPRRIRDSLNTEVARDWADLEIANIARWQKDLLAAVQGNPPAGLDFNPNQ